MRQILGCGGVEYFVKHLALGTDYESSSCWVGKGQLLSISRPVVELGDSSHSCSKSEPSQVRGFGCTFHSFVVWIFSSISSSGRGSYKYPLLFHVHQETRSVVLVKLRSVFL